MQASYTSTAKATGGRQMLLSLAHPGRPEMHACPASKQPDLAHQGPDLPVAIAGISRNLQKACWLSMIPPPLTSTIIQPKPAISAIILIKLISSISF